MWTWFGSVGRRKDICVVALLSVTFLGQALAVLPLDGTWDRQDNWVDGPPNNKPKVTKLEVVCGKTHMTVQLEFDRVFNGIVFSKGKHSEHNCVYVASNSNRQRFIFDVFYDACGTKPDLHGNFYENTVIIQYGSDIIEAWDEAKRLRCEWHEAYEKAAAQPPPIRLADLDVVELNFQGDNIDCWMEIQEGKGPWSREVSGLVPLGSPLTMVVAINDQEGQFDMRVKSCFAHDGHKAPIQLTDEWGCVMRPKMLSPFIKVRDYNGRASVVSYSHFFAFKFPDTMDVHINCKVEVCRHGCPDSCQKTDYKPLDLPAAGGSDPRRPELPPNELNVVHESKIVTVKAGSSKYKTAALSLYHSSPSPHRYPAINEADNYVPPSPLPLLVPKKDGIKYVASEIKNSNGGISGIKLVAAKDEDSSEHVVVVEHSEPEEEPIPKPEPTPKPDSNKNTLSEDIRISLEETVGSQDDGARDHQKAESIKTFNVYNHDDDDTDIKQSHYHHHHHQHQNGDHLAYGQKLKPGYSGGHDVPASSLKDKERKEIYIHPVSEPEPSFKPILSPHSSHPPTKVEFSRDQHFGLSSINQEVYSLGKNPRLEDNQQPRGPAPPASSVNLFQHQGPLGPPQPDQSSGRQRFIPPVLYKPPKPHYPYPIPQFVPPKPLFINVAQRADSGVNVPHFHDGLPQIELRSYQGPNGPVHGTEFVQFPQGPRSIRLRRSAADGREIGVQQVYHAVSSVDLAFEPNATSDHEQVYSGRREEIVYGVCLPLAGFAVGLGFLLFITVGSLVVCGYLVYLWKLQLIKASGQNTLNGLSAKVKNGRMELFYRRGGLMNAKS